MRSISTNPKVGLDWTASGQQKEVVTPGKNEKRYVAGALDVRTQIVIWVEGTRKTSYLFLDLLDRLTRAHRQAVARRRWAGFNRFTLLRWGNVAASWSRRVRQRRLTVR
jgi:hypothetical protein